MNQKFEELRKYIATESQICYARLASLEEGSARGQRIVDVNNGSGLSFTVTPDRGMNLVECHFNGIPIAYRTANHRNLAGNFFLKDWTGGLMTTCGLRNVGTPSGTQPLHGEISREAAEQLSIQNQGGNIKISGVLYEGALFDCNLVLAREIETAYGCNEISITDTVTNRGENPEFTEILYHCNLGYPFISECIKFVSAEHNVIGRDDAAKADVANWDKYPAPLANFAEYCYCHELPADADGWAEIAVQNPELGIALTFSYDTSTLPRLMEWKKPSKNAYLLGMEPTNSSLAGCEADKANGLGKILQPGESITYRMKIKFSTI